MAIILPIRQNHGFVVSQLLLCVLTERLLFHIVNLNRHLLLLLILEYAHIADTHGNVHQLGRSVLVGHDLQILSLENKKSPQESS